MILLSSYNRLTRALCVEDNAKNRRAITSSLYAVSSNIQAYINRDLELGTKIEDFDIHNKETEFWIKAPPVNSITSVYHDFSGLFDGSEQALTDYFIGRGKSSIVINYPETSGKRVLRVTYNGGLSASATMGTYGIGSVIGTFLADKFVTGSVTGATGIIVSVSATSITIDVLYGAFAVGDVLTMQTTEGGTDSPGISASITSVTVQSLVEMVPDITQACELQISYNFGTRNDFEVTNIKNDETSRRDTQKELTYSGTYNDLQPEVRSLLNKYKRYVMQ